MTMTTGSPLICRTCGGVIAEEKGTRYCKNGCQIYTAQPVGSEYMTPRSVQRDNDGKLWETGGAVGCIRRVPTCRD